MDKLNEVTDIDKLDEFTPESIADKLFSKEPGDPCSYMILAYEPGQTNTDASYYFEILITILLEGLDIFSGGLSSANLNNFTDEHITILDPWFRSIGFSLVVQVCDKKDTHLYNNYYCKIRIRTPLYETLFAMKKVDKNYHFLLNGSNLEENKLKKYVEDLFGVFINDDNKVYKISFKFTPI